MRLTKTKLKQIIKEETQAVLLELEAGAPCREDRIAKLVADLDKRIAAAKEKEPERFERWVVGASKSLSETPEEWESMVRSGFYSADDRQEEHKKMMWLLLQKYTGKTIGPDPCKIKANKNPKCMQHIEALKKDGFWPLKSAHFWNAKGTAVRILQRNKETGKAQWFIAGTKASDTELLAAAMTCLKNKCARGSKVKIKGDRRIKMMQAKAVTKEDLEAYCSEIW